jgi:hypothetical protein
MALTMWTNVITGQRLDRDELNQLRDRAHRLYEVNSSIFEDELDALSALGVVPLLAMLSDGGRCDKPPGLLALP